ncbi:MAG: aryl-sulfate sulfotransferase [Polyangiaceae bacterium]
MDTLGGWLAFLAVTCSVGTPGCGSVGAGANASGGSGSGGETTISALAPSGSAKDTPESLAGTCQGYTVFSTEDVNGNFTSSQLIDMQGNIVHTWNTGAVPARMLPGGDLIGCSGVTTISYDAVAFQQVAWNSDVSWSFVDWEDSGGGAWASRQHHDYEREGNPVGYYAPGQDFVVGGSTMVLAHSRRTVTAVRDDAIDDDVIYQLDGAGALTGTPWYAGDHVAELGFDAAALTDIRTRNPGTVLEWLHGNSMSLVGSNHWFDEGHSEFDPNNIVYSSRNANIVVIISHETGDIVWRIGPDFAGRPEEKLGQFAGQHNPHIIPEGLPGAGNMLVFDDGGASGFGDTSQDGYRYERSWSRVLEFNPVTMDIVWQYGSADGADNFYSGYLSNAQRLPNGNTLIDIGTSGQVIEVSAAKEILWKYSYVPPIAGNSAWVYRAYRIPPEWLPAGENAAAGNYPSWSDLFE